MRGACRPTPITEGYTVCGVNGILMIRIFFLYNIIWEIFLVYIHVKDVEI